MKNLRSLGKEELISYIKALEENSGLMADLFDISSALICVITSQERITKVNKAWRNKLGYSPSELSYLRLNNLIHPNFYEATIKSLSAIKPTEEATLDTVFISKKGEHIHVSGTVNCSSAHDKSSVYHAIFTDITDRVKAERAQSLLYSISNLMLESKDLESLYFEIHKELDKVIEAKNFYIALHEPDKNVLRFPYFVDEHFPHPIRDVVRKYGRGLTEYTMELKKPALFYKRDVLGLLTKGNIDITGNIPESWLAVPFKLDGKVNGLIAVQCYHNQTAYTQRDLELLDFISGQVALAITRKGNEEEIRQQSARLNTIFSSSTHLIWTINKNLELIAYNSQYEDTIREFFSVKVKDRTKEGTPFANDNRLREDNKFWYEKYKLAFAGQSMHFEVLLKDKKGRDLWKEIFINPIYNINGEINEISGIATDITSKKQSELALLESEEMFRNIFNSFQDIYFRCTIKGNITMISPSVKELLNYEPERVLDKNITNYYLYNTRVKDLIRQLVKSKSVRNFEASVIKKNGQLIQCICNIRLIYGKNGKPIEIEGVARDITELKRTNLQLVHAKEVAEKSLKVKERFLANMSHEIRTPMNGVIGVVDLLSSTNLDEEQRGYVEIIKKSSRTLLNILNDILDLSKIEAGKMQLRMAVLRLRNVVDKLYSLFSQQATAKGIELNYQIQTGLPEYVIADETRLLQVLSNLTSNAIKFTDQGGAININVTGVEQRGTTYLLKIEVVDTGIGIAEAQLEKLFNSFSQVDNSMTKAYGGTGLGLVISKELCKLMNGDIGVYSQPGTGSTFWFTFEADEAEAKEFEIQEKESDKLLKHAVFDQSKQPLLLLVDDNEVNRQVGGTILRKAGCIVDLAKNGAEAIEKIQRKQYDLVFMDIQMPEMDGITATQTIKTLNLDHLPTIIAMTAYSMEEDRQNILEAGLDDYIAKPIKAEELILKVKEYVNSTLVGTAPAAKGKKKTKSSSKNVIIEDEAVAQLKKWGGMDLVLSAYTEFNEEASEQIGNCFDAFKNNDFQELENNLHSLKGSAATLGIKKLSETAAQLEKQIKEKDYKFVNQKLEKLQGEFSEFQDFFQNNYNN